MSDNKKYGSYFNAAQRAEKHREYFITILKDARKASNMTQQQVANKAGISLRQYQKFESGERKLITASFRIAMDVILALEIKPDVLLNYTNR